MFAVSGAAGCNLVKKAASGDEISQRDMVNTADSEYKENERENKKASDYAKRIERTLGEIEEKRKEGQFSSAEYREKTLQRHLDKLKELDSGHDMLKEAPKRLAKLKETYTKDVYERKALTESCEESVNKAKESRMEDKWRYVDRELDNYVQCRRKLEDAGGDEKAIAAMDSTYKEEFAKFAEYSLEKIEAERKERNFRTAVAFEKNLEQKLEAYNEVDDSEKFAKGVAKRMEKVRMTYRDPAEVEAEKAEEAFNSWKKTAEAAFTKEMQEIEAAEAKAKPDYDAGVAALEKGEYRDALEKLNSARQKLYSAAYPSSVALDSAVKNGSLKRGLSYKIASAIARVHFEDGNVSKLYPELSIIKEGRTWLDGGEELKVRLYDILADRQDQLAPKASEPVKSYASRYSDTASKYRFSKQAADAKVGAAYAMLGVDLDTITHRSAGSSPEDNAGKVVYVDEAVTKVDGKYLHFDFRGEYSVPTKCWHTNKISSVNAYTGRVSYEQKCKYKKVKRGYILKVEKPRGVKVTKGDVVAFYATVGKKEGEFTVGLNEPGYVRIAPNGKTAWYLGVNVAK
jgi:hypothetical protein